MLQASHSRSKRSASDLGYIQGLYDRGEYRKTLFQAQRALRSRREHIGLNTLAGFSALQLGEAASADHHLGQAVELTLTNGDTGTGLAQALMQTRRFQQAVALFAADLEKDATNATALNGLGVCLLETGAVDNAIALLGEALKLAPQNADFAADLGRAFVKSGQEKTALSCYEIACKLAPMNSRKLQAYARLLFTTGSFETGVELLAPAVEKWPRDASLLNTYASFLNAIGKSDDAVAHWEAAIAADPSYGTAYLNFSARNKTDAISHFDQRLNRELKQDLPPETESKLRFAKVKIHEEREEFEEAYEELCRANALHFPETGFDLANELRLFRQLKRQFSDGVATFSEVPKCSPVPIFILGLPRSGSSLVETILGRHSEILQRGELSYLAPLVKHMGLLERPLTADQAQNLQQSYVSRLSQFGQKPYITDKMPLNFRLIGHIASAMPNARILHVFRDPKATCWSNFHHRLAGEGLGFNCDVESLLGYFDLYQDLMAFWHDRFPGRIIDVDYEALVANPDEEIPSLIGALGLGWEEACLAPQDSDHITRTASQEQVRKKIYKGSAQGWRRYEAQAGGWLSRLPDHGAQTWIKRRASS